MDQRATQRVGMDSLILVSNDQLSSMVGDEAIILNTRTGRYFGLDPVGARVWELLQRGNLSIGQVLQALLDEYEVEADRCRHDLLQLLDALHAQGLIEIARAT